MTAIDRNMVLQLVLQAAAHHPNRPAMIIDGVAHSYEWLMHRSGAIAARLATLAQPGDRCAVLGRRSALSYTAFLGALGAGQIYVPLSPHDPDTRQADKLTQSDVKSLLLDASCLPLAGPILERMANPPIVLAPDSTPADIHAANLPGHVAVLTSADFPAVGDLATVACTRSGEDAAYLLFTSGSTGKPKGVVVSLAAVHNYVVAMRELLQGVPEDRFSQGFDPAFDLGIHDMLVCWASAAALIPLPEFKLRYLDEVRDRQITVWFSIPSSIALAEKTGQLKPGSMPSLRQSLFCGEALMAHDARCWRRAASNSRVLNLYGPTEATIAVSLFDATDSQDPAPVVPIGVPFGGTQFHLLDPDGEELAAGKEGELAIAGPQLAIGYWRDPLLTERRFPTIRDRAGAPLRVYRTGDRASRDVDTFRFLGRLDNEVKIHGYRINPLEVEAALSKAADPALAIVVTRVPGKLSPIDLVGFVGRSERTSEEILKRCREILPNYMWPSQIFRVDDFARLANGKIDRQTLRRQAGEL